ncbi:MAG: MFS transporter [Anaerolineales bacterium]|nr:MFS transporter [Anaerolineales bacterium]
MRRENLQTGIYYAAFLTVGAIIASLGPTLPALANNISVGVAAIGFMFTARSFGYLFGALLGGAFYDRVRGHSLMSAFLLLASGVLFFTPDAHQLRTLSILVFLLGFTQGGVDVGANTLLIRVRKDKPAPYLNAMYFFAGVGSFLAPLYLSKVSFVWGYRGLGLVILPVIFGLLFAPSPHIIHQQSDKPAQINDYKAFIAFVALAFIIIGSEVSFGGWLFTFFSTSGLGDQAAAYRITSAFWLSITIGRLLSIYWVSHFKPQAVITIYLTGAALSAAVLLAFHSYPVAVWIGSVAMGISVAALFPTSYAYIQQRIHISGKLTGVVWASGSLGAMILPWGIGKLMDATVPSAMMSVMLAIWIFALTIFLVAIRPPALRRPRPSA